ncbi:hypothetical protein [Melittangium boletus]|uniref:Uncharacterized protein n=1 Tax=Melittangium boletus DSM 14713 TaxID=1294270 RepID=A0A250ICH4_9BACT|nr:hypothetical protein [Melittangium boletus]ATB29465.1 hypothetical protein MEBOL_002915 [Melittangium boletus DSM 14713]
MSRGLLIVLLGAALSAGAATGEGVPASPSKAPEKAKTPAAAPAKAADWQQVVREAIIPPPEPEPAPDVDPFGFSVYQGVRPEPMGEQTLINGARMQISSLIVNEPPHLVMKYYEESLGKLGVVNVMRGRVEQAGLLYMSFRPPGSQNLKTLTLVPHGAGTVILASIGNPEELLADQKALPDGLPQPPNAEPPNAIQQLEPGLSSRSAFFVVRSSTPQKVQAFYREELLKRGYVPTPVDEGLPGMESYQKGSSMLSITAKPHEDPSAVTVSLMWFDP